MPDIAMCRGFHPLHALEPEKCPLRRDCYRYLATPSRYRQTYFSEMPLSRLENVCTYQMPIACPTRECTCWECPNVRHLDPNGHLPGCNETHGTDGLNEPAIRDEEDAR